jgi:hypothetical protein
MAVWCMLSHIWLNNFVHLLLVEQYGIPFIHGLVIQRIKEFEYKKFNKKFESNIHSV